jgi:hypothetical protein
MEKGDHVRQSVGKQIRASSDVATNRMDGFWQSESQCGRRCRLDEMPAPERIGAQEGSVRVRSTCDFHDELATIPRKTILEDEGQRLCRRFAASRTPPRQVRGVLFAEGLLHFRLGQEPDLRARHQPGPAISGKNDTSLLAYSKVASTPTARQSPQLKRLEPAAVPTAAACA